METRWLFSLGVFDRWDSGETRHRYHLISRHLGKTPVHPRILIVDDDPDLLQGIRSRLHGHYEVEVAQGGPEALRKLTKDPAFSVIMCDFRMPDMDGIELLSRVRTEFPHLVRVMLTGHGDMQVATAAINAGGIFKMLLKPCLDDELEGAMASAVAQYAVQALALEDHLLGIGNRRAFDKALLRNHNLALRHHRPYALAVADVDHFKRYNDRYGHVAGDHALKAVADAIRSACRVSDEVFRYGGEEVAIILPDATGNGALTACERIRKAVETLCLLQGTADTGVTISLGVTVFDGAEKVGAEQILLRADQALYLAKSAGRNRVSLWAGARMAPDP